MNDRSLLRNSQWSCRLRLDYIFYYILHVHCTFVIFNTFNINANSSSFIQIMTPHLPPTEPSATSLQYLICLSFRYAAAYNCIYWLLSLHHYGMCATATAPPSIKILHEWICWFDVRLCQQQKPATSCTLSCSVVAAMLYALPALLGSIRSHESQIRTRIRFVMHTRTHMAIILIHRV